MALNMNGKIVMITGASSGIGQACAQAFAQHGARLLLCARRAERLADIAQALVAEYGVQVHYAPLDVRQRAQVEAGYSQLPEQWRAIDVLVNNAGLAAGLDPLQEGKFADWEAMIDTNIKGLLYVTRTILPDMVARNHGHIVNIGSIAGHEVYPRGNVYCATKHAVKALSQGIKIDVAHTAIRVTEIDPGMVETEFSHVRFEGNTERAQQVYQGLTPLSAADIADAIIYATTRPPHVNISETATPGE